MLIGRHHHQLDIGCLESIPGGLVLIGVIGNGRISQKRKKEKSKENN
jgi:hypothetical protein